MSDRLIDSSILTATANKLREKGIVGDIEYKDNGFADAILNLPTAPIYDWSYKIKPPYL